MSHTRTSSFPFAARVSVGVLLLVAAVILLVQRRAATAPSLTTASSAPQASAPPPTPAPLAASAEARRARDAMRDQILETLRKQAASAPPRPAPASPRASTSNAESAPPKGHYEPEYIRQVFREDMFPLLRKCYEGALARKPTLAGRLVLTFRIIGDPSVGGVVEDAGFADDSDLKDAEMETCVRESTMTLTFDKPPSGGGEVTVKYPVMFSPGDDDDDDGGAPANKPDSSR
jgi:hypothetical protein